MRGVFQVAGREIRQAFRSKGYVISSAVVLLIVVAAFVLPAIFATEVTEYEVGLVGDGGEPIVAAADLLANATAEGEDAGTPVEFNITEYATREQATAGLEAGDVEAVIVDDSELILETHAAADSELAQLLQQGAGVVALETLVAEEGEAAERVIELVTSDPLETTSLEGDDAPDFSAGGIAFFSLMLLYLAILLYGNWILTGVTEEKSNRVVEVLLSTLKPWQLLAGKILGIGTLGILQFLVTIVVAVVASRLTDALEIPPVEFSLAVSMVVWFILGFLLYAMLYGAAGSLASRSEDAQNVAFPLSLIAAVSFIATIGILEDPRGTAAVVTTLIPFTAPFAVPARVALDAIPLWQYLSAIVIVSITIVCLTLVAGRLYKGGLLRFGKRVGIKEAWKGAAE